MGNYVYTHLLVTYRYVFVFLAATALSTLAGSFGRMRVLEAGHRRRIFNY